MSRIDPPKRPPLWLRGLLAFARWRYGRDMRPLQLAGAPAGAGPAVSDDQPLRARSRPTLPADTRLLAMLLVAERNGCDWCIDFGRSLTSGPNCVTRPCMSPRTTSDRSSAPPERAALRYADEAEALAGARCPTRTFAHPARATSTSARSSS